MTVERYALVNSADVVIDVALWDGTTTWTRDASVSQTILLTAGESCGAGFTYVFGGSPRFVAPSPSTIVEYLTNELDVVVGTTRSGLGTGRVATSSTSIVVDKGKANEIEFQRAALTGDVTASANSNATAIASGAVTFAKMQAVSANVLLGNDATGTTVEEIACTAAGRALLDDADAAAQLTTLGAAASTHSHGNLTSGGAIGSTAELVVKTGTSGAVEALAAPAATSFLSYKLGTSSLSWETVSTPTITEQEFTSSGSNTYTKPAGLKYVIVEMCGGGGGGGDGSTTVGGNGGCAGVYVHSIIDESEITTSTLTVTVGAGGTTAGGTGGDTQIQLASGGAILLEAAGGRGASSDARTLAGGTATNGFGAGGGASGGTSGRYGGLAAGGGGAGQNNTTGAGLAGGAAARAAFSSGTSNVPAPGGGAAGGANGGGAGTAASVTVRGFGDGAGGGGANNAGTGGAGGAGTRGSGGGGGGRGSTAGGAGGVGGNGFVRMISVSVS